MKTKGKRQSTNVEHGKPLDANEQSMVNIWGYIPPREGPGYTGIAKQQLKDQNAFARGRRMGLEN